MIKFWENLMDNEYVFLSAACCTLVVVPILAIYLLSWTKSVMAALP